MAGRPSKYSPSIQKKANRYLEKCGNEFWDYHKTIGEKSDSYERKVNITLPSIEGLAIFLNVNRSTLYEWREKHKTFSDTLESVEAMQKKMLLEHGLNGDYNPTIAKLILSSNHGMSDRGVLTTEDEEGKVIPISGMIITKENG